MHCWLESALLVNTAVSVSIRCDGGNVRLCLTYASEARARERVAVVMWGERRRCADGQSATGSEHCNGCDEALLYRQWTDNLPLLLPTTTTTADTNSSGTTSRGAEDGLELAVKGIRLSKRALEEKCLLVNEW